MLHSLSELLRRESGFTANASHQLRTPLAGPQLALEAGLAQEDDAQLRPLLAEALAAPHRLLHTVEEVLRLSRPPDRPRRHAAGDTPVAQLRGLAGTPRRRRTGRPRGRTPSVAAAATAVTRRHPVPGCITVASIPGIASPVPTGR
ncbi:histidine kinase dimerization/phospho-acceptor domain-containing protein [Streptomyces sp. NPDC042638]|uniref:histidine kinase dimerization/phospho-acceptor domain-containing protein n=1 Tax=Streptomyces sp. NPDC042638 TaxID=3154333 RepID=UPI00341020D3